MIANVEGFREFIAAQLRCDPPARIEPGRFTRFSRCGKRGDDSCFAKLFPDLEGGIVGDFRTGETWTWHARRARPLTDAEQRAWRERIERERREAEALRAREEKEAAQRAKAIWDAAQPAPDEHQYLRRKAIKAHGVRLYRGPLAAGGMRCDGALVIPLRNAAGEIQTLEFISPDGEKRFLPGGRKVGAYFALGTPSATICVAEGFATGASVHEATGYAVAVAFDAGNLEPVARALRAKFPKARLIIAGDHDASGTGQRAAEAAARAVGGYVALPGEKGKDWNDTHRERGAEAVRRGIEGATTARLAGDTVQIVTAANVPPEQYEWVWRDYLAAGKLHIIAGAPGTGKTTIALAMAATVSCGGRWPDGTRAEAADVLIWSGEDDIADTIVPRLLANGADPRRCHVIRATLEGDGDSRAFDPATDMPRLREAVVQRGIRPRLLIVDPVVSAVAGDSHKNAETRRGLQPVVNLAQELRCAVLGVSHFSKGTAGRDPIERVTGSVAFGALPRVVFATAKRPEEDGGGRILVRAKTNIGPEGDGFVYELAQASVPGHPRLTASQVRWGQPMTGAARDLLARAETALDDEERSEIAEACDWLRDVLAMGAVEAREIQRQAKAQGFSVRTVQRARVMIGARSRREGFGRGARRLWLPPIDAIDAIDASHKTLASMGDVGIYGARKPGNGGPTAGAGEPDAPSPGPADSPSRECF
jgi:putative DNA primase/helicase